MKKISLFLGIFLISYTGFSQSKPTVELNKKLVYSLKDRSSSEQNFGYDISIYLGSKKTNLIEINYASYYYETLMYKEGKRIPLNPFGLERNVVVKNDKMYNSFAESPLFDAKVELVAMNKSDVIFNIPCNYYEIKSTDDNFSSPFFETCLCIDEKNETKNLKSLLPSVSIDGLILALKKIDSDESFELTDMKNVSIKLDFDFDKEYKDLEEKYLAQKAASEAEYEAYAVDSIAVTEAVPYYGEDSYYDYYSDPLCNTYEYFQDMDANLLNIANLIKDTGCTLLYADSDYDGIKDYKREEVIKIYEKHIKSSVKSFVKSKAITKKEGKTLTASLEKVLEAAKKYNPKELESSQAVDAADYAYAVADTAAVAYDEYDFYTKYESVYKDMVSEPVSLAAELNDSKELFKDNMPQYCSELSQKIPQFEDKKLYYEVYNLVGQICDLYIYQNGGYVDYFTTINSFRKSLLEIENKREKMSKKDQKLLKEYLNSLD
ncbi:hypothetical protein [Paenimyroides ceti]